jgi:DNA-binding CsgD family transcriptional regulator
MIPMRQHTRRGDICYEPFCGSGSQIIAAERLGRRCLAIEISPHYCDLIVRRWIAFVGEQRAPADLVQRYRVPEERMNGESPPLPKEQEAGDSPSVMTLIRSLQAGQLSPANISVSNRRLCVEHLTAEGYSLVEVAELLKVSERTVARDRAAILQANSVERDSKLVGQVVGRLLRQAECSIARMRRVSGDKDTPPAVKVEAEHRSWQVERELAEVLQKLGYLPTAAQEIRADLTHHLGSMPALPELQLELQRLQEIRVRHLPQDLQAGLQLEQAQQVILKLSVSDQIDQLREEIGKADLKEYNEPQ